MWFRLVRSLILIRHQDFLQILKSQELVAQTNSESRIFTLYKQECSELYRLGRSVVRFKAMTVDGGIRLFYFCKRLIISPRLR